MKQASFARALRMLAVSASVALMFGVSFAQSAPRAPHAFARPPFHLHGSAKQNPVGVSPQQIRRFYGFDQLPARGYGGDDQVIAIVDAYDNPNVEADLRLFSKTFGLSPCASPHCFTKVYATADKRPPPPDASWAFESSLDVQWAHAIAPNARIVLVEAASSSLDDLMSAIALATSPAPGGIGAKVVSISWGTAEFLAETQFDGQFASANGVSFVAASGDGGNGVDYPAASPYVLGVGGTTIATDASGAYAGETAWAGSGGGQSTVETAPAYQSNFGIPSDSLGLRGVPDVAYDADPASGFAVYDSYGYAGQSGWFVVGGTSAGVPQWSALIAIANSLRIAHSKTTLNAVGAIQAVLYGLASSNYAANFLDIVSGSNGACGTLCTATVGYDYVTGLGRPMAANLVHALIAAP
ncbi:MAG: S53 family peptidase [Burkholderia sp.]|jgi:subtilase family serine protease|uniref:S53 family peptidase n=3 Tax=Pseudomonadota TaxID=1224 RepID=UPI00258B582D|nr:S53 family peptidase [Burkholderia sp.]MCA3776923.1 S53 family peptidase [Burkholderia sp.]MCA3788677.1 S53 family peptidase [Burkholderia sp.]MCA3796560.1 S53 family peptidase [Burkholderia sp.]MCA3805191.1 S53 family peptidase [Burkholderia sp.]MCA3813854.1 S53 family peptidase [Burkholderia sp.]